jgi:hypothetical protein
MSVPHVGSRSEVRDAALQRKYKDIDTSIQSRCQAQTPPPGGVGKIYMRSCRRIGHGWGRSLSRRTQQPKSANSTVLIEPRPISIRA